MPVKEAAIKAINDAWAQLEQRAAADFKQHGWDFKQAQQRHFAYVRFTNQLSDFEVLWDHPRLRLDRRFGRTDAPLRGGLHHHLPGTGARVRGRLPSEGVRKVHHRGKRLAFLVYEMDALQAGNVVNGPAIIEHPATTFYIPPDRQAAFDERRLIHYRDGAK